jgi:hypothetical protein
MHAVGAALVVQRKFQVEGGESSRVAGSPYTSALRHGRNGLGVEGQRGWRCDVTLHDRTPCFDRTGFGTAGTDA